MLHKEIQELLDEKLAVFNTIVDNDKTILDYKYDNAHIKANMEAATAAMKTDIENAMTGRKRVATVVAIITSILVIGVICAATLLITKNINTSLTQFGKVLEELSSGNLQVRACIVAQDEFGTFSIQLNQFVAKLANVLEDIQLLINEVGNKNLVVGNTMKHVARGDTEEGEANDGVLYLQKMFQEVSDNVMTQSTNTEESVAATNEQLETNTGILTSINKLKEYLGTTTLKVADIKKDMEELGSDKKLATETTKIIEIGRAHV